ncbi:MAG: TadE/TadG family type IV pilus assembly protein [Acidimicrobiales bacterium]
MMRIAPKSLRASADTDQDDERGAALIEAAIIMPVLLLIVFGVFEFGLLFRDELTLAQSTRDGARAGSAYGNDYDADFKLLRTIENASTAVPPELITRIVVFDPGTAEENGAPTQDCKDGIAVVDVCNVYTPANWADTARFGCNDSNDLDKFWCPADRRVQLGNVGYIGVWVEFLHPFVTGFFGEDITLTDQTIMRIEPKEY